MTNKSKISWPLTQAAAQKDLQKKIQQASTLAEVGELVTAANSVKMPVTAGVQKAMKGEDTPKLPGKSARRLEKRKRREAIDEMDWSEITKISNACAQTVTVAGRLNPMLTRRELLTLVEDKRLLSRLVKSIINDTRTLATDFQKIQALHKGKTGMIAIEDVQTAVSVFTDYVNFTELSNACLIPSMVHVSELIAPALTKLRAINPELANQINMEVLQYDMKTMRDEASELTGTTTQPTPAEVKAEAPAEATA